MTSVIFVYTSPLSVPRQWTRRPTYIKQKGDFIYDFITSLLKSPSILHHHVSSPSQGTFLLEPFELQSSTMAVNPISGVLLIIITILREPHCNPHNQVSKTNKSPVPPVGVFMIAGCGADLFVNICLTLLGYATVLFQVDLDNAYRPL